MAADISPGSGNSYPASLIVFNNELYFKAGDGTNGYELWKYDGTNAPNWLLIRAGSGRLPCSTMNSISFFAGYASDRF